MAPTNERKGNNYIRISISEALKLIAIGIAIILGAIGASKDDDDRFTGEQGRELMRRMSEMEKTQPSDVLKRLEEHDEDIKERLDKRDSQ